MNLYTIDFLHASPKDREYGFKCLLLANSDEEVYNWLASEPKIGNSSLTHSWEYKEEKMFSLYDDDYNEIGKETFKEKMIRIKGEINDDDFDFGDAYYGITLFGWSLLKENINPENYSELIELEICFKAI